jgi:hypothetical protein
MNLFLLIPASLLLALPFNVNPSLTFTIGPGSVPQGTASVSYDAWDLDVLYDDILIQGAAATRNEDGGYSTGNLELECPNPPCSVVEGPAGASGESEVEVQLKYTFRDSNGNVIGVLWSGVKVTKCDCPV